MTPDQYIHSLHEALVTTTRTICRSMATAKLLTGYVGTLPFTTSKEPLVVDYTVQHTYDQDAVKTCQNALRDLYIMNGLDTKVSRKYHGILVFAKNPELLAHFMALNDIKETLKTFITTHYGTGNARSIANERFKAIHNNIPGAMTVHLYRKVHLVNNLSNVPHTQDLKRVQFYWIANKDSLVHCAKDKLLKEIEAHISSVGIESAVDEVALYDRILAIPESNLRRRRPVIPHIKAALTFDKTPKMTTCPLPLIAFQDEPPAVGSVPDYQPNKATRNTRGDKKATTIIGHWHGSAVEQMF
jgi:DNA replication terminus site-binding protein